MQAAPSRSASAARHRRVDNSSVISRRSAADDSGLLHALPIAAAIFTVNNGKLWVEAMNSRFLELAGCGGNGVNFVETFKRYAEGNGGPFITAFLSDSAGAPDELEIAEGEGVGRRFLTLKLSPLSPGE